MDLATAKSLLPVARQLRGLASQEWCESYNLDNTRAEICLRENPGSPVEPIAVILPACPYDDRQLMIRAPQLLDATLTLLDYAFAIIREHRPVAEKQKDFAAECAMKCNTIAFRRYLIEMHGLEETTDAERINTRVRTILRIGSRAELNTDPDARSRWIALRDNFEAWRKMP